MDTVLFEVGGVGDLVVCKAVVVHAGFLLGPVAESIPLRTALGVDVDQVVEGDESEGLEVLECVYGFFASETWLVDFLESPAMKGVSLNFGN